jgi:CRISPR system Cascade subunit CasA
MTFSFNLLDEKWIPCRMSGGRTRELNLVDTLCQSHRVHAILHSSPLVTVALHRLLLAILHRVFGPSDWHAWQGIWSEGQFDETHIRQYLEQWRDRFDLFNKDYPFYQTEDVGFEYAKSAAKLPHELASGNNPTLFDHTAMENPPMIYAAEAARLVVALQSYAVGGLVSSEKGRKKQDGSADSSFMVKGAAVLAIGRHLFETLMLNLVQYNPDDEEPFAFDREKDLPAWEREKRANPVDRLPDGYLDWLTWQSRRIRLKPEIDDQDRLFVREAVIMKGYQLPDNQWRYGRETMIAFRKFEKATRNQEPWLALAFTQDKALWRDMLSLIQSVDEESARSKTVDWLADLRSKGVIEENRALRLSAFGLCSNRAKIDFWRHETLPLPLSYLSDQELVSSLRQSLSLAEDAGKALRGSIRYLAKLALAPDENREPVREDIDSLCDELSPGRLFWTKLEIPFKQLVVDLPEDISTDQYGSFYGEYCLPQWAEIVKRAAREAFYAASAATGESARALKARARAESDFTRRLNDIMARFRNELPEGGEE